jgi:hypothetical protein
LLLGKLCLSKITPGCHLYFSRWNFAQLMFELTRLTGQSELELCTLHDATLMHPGSVHSFGHFFRLLCQREGGRGRGRSLSVNLPLFLFFCSSTDRYREREGGRKRGRGRGEGVCLCTEREIGSLAIMKQTKSMFCQSLLVCLSTLLTSYSKFQGFRS